MVSTRSPRSGISVYAPDRAVVSAVVGDVEYELRKRRNGYHLGHIPFGAGTDYKLRIDNDLDRTYPDPRSLWQPHGVHGSSRTYNHKAFEWTDAGWEGRKLYDGSSTGMVYEVHVGTFTPEGTFDSAIEKFEHLKQLGVTHIEVMPTAGFPGEFGWSYDGVNPYAPAEIYGGPDGLKRFINAAHETGLAVVLDLNLNHRGTVGDYSTKFSNYDYAATEWGAGNDLSNPQHFDFYVQNTGMYLEEFHADGIRLDAVHRFDPRHAAEFIGALKNKADDVADKTGIPRTMIAETSYDPNLVRSPDYGGLGLDAIWNDELSHALIATLMNGPRPGLYNDYNAADIGRAMERIYPHGDGHQAWGLSGHNFISSIANHDITGNTETGERLSQRLGMDGLRIAMALMMTSPTVPMIFQGDEWGTTSPFAFFADLEDKDETSRDNMRKGRRAELEGLGFNSANSLDPTARSTFDACKLDWSQIHDPANAAMLQNIQALAALRVAAPALSNGDLRLTSARFEDGWLDISRGRWDNGKTAQVVVNLKPEARKFDVRDDQPGAMIGDCTRDGVTLTIAARSAVVVVSQAAIETALPYEVRRPSERLLGRELQQPEIPADDLALLKSQNATPMMQANVGYQIGS